jgi:undecaprenyl pyrophosphate phosphatase UppP
MESLKALGGITLKAVSMKASGRVGDTMAMAITCYLPMEVATKESFLTALPIMAREKKLELTAMYEEGTGRMAGPGMMSRNET